jgi:hypothetical protein
MTLTAYKVPLDIANRGLQHLGVPRINTFADGSQAANEMAFAYDKVRQAELRRNLWRFATRRAVIRPIDLTTMLIQPSAWDPTVNYPIGSIVSFPTGANWMAISRNTNVQPSNTATDINGNLAWDSYYGPMTASQFNGNNSQTTSNSLVFVSPGSGTPSASGALSTTVSQGYQPGELTFIPIGDGTAVVFQCVAATAESPLQTDAWIPNRIYQTGQVVAFPQASVFTIGPGGSLLGGTDTLGTTAYVAIQNVNLGNQPDITNDGNGWPHWNSTTTWAVGNQVAGSDNQLYVCILQSVGTDGINGQNPVVDFPNTFWVPQGMFINMWTPVPHVMALNPAWQLVNVTLVPISIVWPYGSGPAEDTASQNVYHVPSNWLREAPEEPRSGLTPWLGGPTGEFQKDWIFEGQYMISRQTNPVLMRFVADVQDVTQFDAMFAEALSLNLAIATGGTIDNDQGTKPQSDYRRLVQEARVVNAIEVGPITPPDDQLISVRY